MPELPEVESARQVIEKGALRRRIAGADDADTYECRPHAPGEIEAALTGRHLVAAHRRGKLMWCATADDDGQPGPSLGLHLGMSGRILVSPRPTRPTSGLTARWRAATTRGPGPDR